MPLRAREKQGREEEAGQYRERVEAIEEILAEHDRQAQERAAEAWRDNPCGADWRNPSEPMRKVSWVAEGGRSSCQTLFRVEWVRYLVHAVEVGRRRAFASDFFRQVGAAKMNAQKIGGGEKSVSRKGCRRAFRRESTVLIRIFNPNIDTDCSNSLFQPGTLTPIRCVRKRRRKSMTSTTRR